MTLDLIKQLAQIAASSAPEPFFGAWTMQERGKATKFSLDGREFLIVNPLDLATERAFDLPRQSDLTTPLLSRPFLGLPIRNLDRDHRARSEYLQALESALRGIVEL